MKIPVHTTKLHAQTALKLLAACLAAITTACTAAPLDLTDPSPLTLSANLTPVGSQRPRVPDAEPRRAINQAPDEASSLPWPMGKSSNLSVAPYDANRGRDGRKPRPAAEAVDATPAAAAAAAAAPSPALPKPPATAASTQAVQAVPALPGPQPSPGQLAAMVPDAGPATAATASPVVTSAVAARDLRVWSVLREQKSLRTSLGVWAGAAGWSLSWELPIDFALDADASFQGTFEEAVTAISNSTWATAHPFQAIFYRGNKVLRIVNPGASK